MGATSQPVPGGGFLHPYMKNYVIQDCPSAAAIFRFSIPRAYGVNVNLRPSGQPPATLAALSHLAETVLMADAAHVFFGAGYLSGCAERKGRF